MKCIALLASYDPTMYLWKTSQHSPCEDSTEFSGRLPRSGMMRNGKLYQQDRLVLPICGNGSGSLPTPCVTDWGGGWCNWLRTKEAWETTTMLVRRLMHHYLGLTGKDRSPGGRWIPNPSYAELLMGYPIGWTDVGPTEEGDSATR
jgi:hypothetical protein